MASCPKEASCLGVLTTCWNCCSFCEPSRLSEAEEGGKDVSQSAGSWTVGSKVASQVEESHGVCVCAGRGVKGKGWSLEGLERDGNGGRRGQERELSSASCSSLPPTEYDMHLEQEVRTDER